MAAKRKVLVEDEEEKSQILGYLHNVSQLQTSAKGRKYFHAVIQTTKDEKYRLVAFSPEKHNTYTMAANLNSPVQLKNAKFSPSRNGELEVIVDRSTSLEMVKQKLDFKKKKLDPPQQSILKSLSDLTEENMLMETASVNIHEDLKTILDYQTHHRLREAQGRGFAEDLNDRVFYWSLGQSIIILVIGVGQVLVLRSFFTEKRGSKP